MRWRLSVSAALILAAAAAAAPPKLELPPEVKGEPGAFVRVAAVTDGKTVSWVAADPGLNLFPVELLKDTKTAVVSAAAPGRYKLYAVTAAGDEISPFVMTVVVIESPPQPPPGPGPDPGPGPTPPAPPAPAKSFRVFLIYESGDLITAEQRAVLYGKDVEQWLTANCTGGKAGWRRRDKDSDGGDDPATADLWKAIRAALKPTDAPCVAVERDGKVTVLPLAATPAAMIDTLKTYKGK